MEEIEVRMNIIKPYEISFRIERIQSLDNLLRSAEKIIREFGQFIGKLFDMKVEWVLHGEKCMMPVPHYLQIHTHILPIHENTFKHYQYDNNRFCFYRHDMIYRMFHEYITDSETFYFLILLNDEQHAFLKLSMDEFFQIDKAYE